MIILSTILFIFLCLIAIGIWYDRIIPGLSKWIKRLSESEKYKNWKKPILYGIFIFICCWFLFQDWGMLMTSVGAQSYTRWGFPASRSAVTLVVLIVTAYFIYVAVKKFRSFYGNPRSETKNKEISVNQEKEQD